MKFTVMACSTLFHPHIITIKDAFTTPSFLCLMTEQVHGSTLASYVRQGSCLPEKAAKFLFQQLCMVLSYCHSQGVYVQNLTPEQVVIDWHPGELPVLKLADCGFVHVTQVRYLTHSVHCLFRVDSACAAHGGCDIRLSSAATTLSIFYSMSS